MKESLEEVRLREVEVVLDASESRKETLRQLATEAAGVCQRPIALISLIDRNYQWVKAQVGLPKIRLARAAGFCEHTMVRAGLLEVNDLRADSRFRENPLVTGTPNLKSYAGTPLLSPRGMPLGALCVIGLEPGSLSEAQRQSLNEIAQRAMAELEPAREASARRERILPGKTSVSELLKLAAQKAFGGAEKRPKFFIQRVVLNDLYCDEFSSVHELGRIFTRFLAEGAPSLTVDSMAGEDGLVTIAVSTEGSSARKLHLREFPAKA